MFINGTVEWRQIRFIGDAPDELELGLFADADSAGDRDAMRSTSGVFLALYGTHRFVPREWAEKKTNGSFTLHR